MRRAVVISSLMLGCAAEPPSPTTPAATVMATPEDSASSPRASGQPAVVPAPRAESSKGSESEVSVEAETTPHRTDPSTDTATDAFVPLKLNEELLARAKKVQPLVVKAARDFQLDPNLINGVIWTESKFNPKARNRSGAKGLMQLMPITARGMAKKLDRRVRVYDPEFSIQAGSKLLSIMLERFDGDEELALFAFARGGGRVRSWQANGQTEFPAGVVRFIARVRRGQRTFEQLGFPDV